MPDGDDGLGRDLTAHDMTTALMASGFGPRYEKNRQQLADRLNRIARGADARMGCGSDCSEMHTYQPGRCAAAPVSRLSMEQGDDDYEPMIAAVVADADSAESTALRSWSLPAPPPDDVTVVHVGEQEFTRDLALDPRWRNSFDGEAWLWSDVLSLGTVVEAASPAPDPFEVDTRVRVKASGRTGVVREVDSRGRHLIFGDDESWITGLTADRLELVPAPVFERGFYRLARDLDVAEYRVAAAGATVAIVGEQTDEHAHLWLVMPSSGVKWTCTDAALAAAGAERVEDR